MRDAFATWHAGRRVTKLVTSGAAPITIEPTPAGYTPDGEIDALIRAGLGDVERAKITQEMHARAMRGEIVRPLEAAAERRRRAAYKRKPDANGQIYGTSGAAGISRRKH